VLSGVATLLSRLSMTVSPLAPGILSLSHVNVVGECYISIVGVNS